jgi:hypothetical protein
MTAGVFMFKRQWIWFGKLISDEGFSLSSGHNSIRYSDKRGTFEFGFEDGVLSPTPFQLAGKPVSLNQSEINEIIDRVIRGIRSVGHAVEVYPK